MMSMRDAAEPPERRDSPYLQDLNEHRVSSSARDLKDARLQQTARHRLQWKSAMSVWNTAQVCVAGPAAGS
jgi:hypothetical protein